MIASIEHNNALKQEFFSLFMLNQHVYALIYKPVFRRVDDRYEARLAFLLRNNIGCLSLPGGALPEGTRDIELIKSRVGSIIESNHRFELDFDNEESIDSVAIGIFEWNKNGVSEPPCIARVYAASFREEPALRKGIAQWIAYDETFKRRNIGSLSTKIIEDFHEAYGYIQGIGHLRYDNGWQGFIDTLADQSARDYLDGKRSLSFGKKVSDGSMLTRIRQRIDEIWEQEKKASEGAKRQRMIVDELIARRKQ